MARLPYLEADQVAPEYRDMPSAKCFLWLYGIGCTGAGCTLGLSGTALFAAGRGVPCCAAKLATETTSAPKIFPGTVQGTGLLAFILVHLA